MSDITAGGALPAGNDRSIEAMIVLGNTRSLNAIDLFIKQLSNPNQTVWVKLWAARGLANVAQDGQIDVETQRGMTAGKAVVDFLAQGFKSDEGIDLTKDKLALQRLKEAAEKAKIELSSAATTEVNLPFITADQNGPKHLVKSITRADLERLGTSFFTTREVGEGTGLGLSICHTIVRNHGGSLLARSEPGEWTEVSFDLPLVT